MTTNILLKNVLLNKIEEIIRTLEMRIKLNAQTILSLDSIDLNATPEGVGVLERLEATDANNNRAEKIIQSCNENIHKLLCIRDIGPQADLKILLYLYSNYERFLPEEFFQIIQAIQEQLPDNSTESTTAFSDMC